jgi:replicative DNA helicase
MSYSSNSNTIQLTGDAYQRLADPDAERSLVGCVILHGNDAFNKAKIGSADFSIYRWRWFWQACESILNSGDYIDVETIRQELKKSGHYEDVTARESLLELMNADGWLHIEVYASKIKEMAERRRQLALFEQKARQICNLSLPLPQPPPDPKNHWTLAELQTADFPDPVGPVRGLLPTGLSILGGRPKQGKSWFLLQLGCSLAMGGEFLQQELAQGRVLYYALEDTPRRLKNRLYKLGVNSDASIEFEMAIKPLHQGGLEDIRQKAFEYTLIIIDTLARAMPGRDFSKDAALFSDILGQLQQIALENNIAILLAQHTRKPNGNDHDPIDDILGTTGLTAPADCVLVLYKSDGKAQLKGRGRDLEDIDLVVQFEPQDCSWQLVGEAEKVHRIESEEEIIRIMSECKEATASEIARILGKNRGNTSSRMSHMWMNGLLKKEMKGEIPYYSLEDTFQCEAR